MVGNEMAAASTRIPPMLSALWASVFLPSDLDPDPEWLAPPNIMDWIRLYERDL